MVNLWIRCVYQSMIIDEWIIKPQQTMKYRDYIKESSTLFMSALDDIITMFKKKKVTEIDFEIPLKYPFTETSFEPTIRMVQNTHSIKKIKLHKDVMYLIDKNEYGHIVGNLSNKMDIFTIYHSVYKHLYENVNVARSLQ